MELNKKSTLPILEEGLQDFGIVLEEKQKEQFFEILPVVNGMEYLYEFNRDNRV